MSELFCVFDVQAIRNAIGNVSTGLGLSGTRRSECPPPGLVPGLLLYFAASGTRQLCLAIIFARCSTELVSVLRSKCWVAATVILLPVKFRVLSVDVGQCPQAVDDHLDGAARLHGQHAQ